MTVCTKNARHFVADLTPESEDPNVVLMFKRMEMYTYQIVTMTYYITESFCSKSFH